MIAEEEFSLTHSQQLLNLGQGCSESEAYLLGTLAMRCEYTLDWDTSPSQGTVHTLIKT